MPSALRDADGPNFSKISSLLISLHKTPIQLNFEKVLVSAGVESDILQRHCVQYTP